MKSVVYLCILSLVLSARIIWDPSIKLSENANKKRTFATHHCAGTGTTHLFWEEIDSQEDWHLFHRAKLSDGKLTSVVQISLRPLPFAQNQISVQSTDDGMHILLAYGGYRRISNKGCTNRNDASCIEIYFSESFNGGFNWTTPVFTNRTNQDDTIHRTTPSLVLEKDTGRVFIAYYINQDNAMVVREPGSSTFSLEYHIGYTFGASLDLGFTKTIDNSTRYLHFIWHSNTVDKTREVLYTRSSNGGKEWLKHRLIVPRYKSEVMQKVAINSDAAENRIYIQYENKNLYYILWSGDHGNTWEEPFVVSRKLINQHTITMCGRNNKGLVFTASPGEGMFAGFLRSFPTDSNKLEDFVFPLVNYDVAAIDAHCGVNNQGKTTLTIAIRDDKKGNIFMVRGTLQ